MKKKGVLAFHLLHSCWKSKSFFSIPLITRKISDTKTRPIYEMSIEKATPLQPSDSFQKEDGFHWGMWNEAMKISKNQHFYGDDCVAGLRAYIDSDRHVKGIPLLPKVGYEHPQKPRPISPVRAPASSRTATGGAGGAGDRSGGGGNIFGDVGDDNRQDYNNDHHKNMSNMNNHYGNHTDKRKKVNKSSARDIYKVGRGSG